MKMDGIYYMPIVFSFKSLLGICLSIAQQQSSGKKQFSIFRVCNYGIDRCICVRCQECLAMRNRDFSSNLMI